MQLGRRDILGLDIGTFSIKAIQLRNTGSGWSVLAGAMVEIGEKGAGTPTKHEANLIGAITNCVNIAGIKTNYAVCSLGGNDVAIRNFDFPNIPADELDTAVVLEARQVCPFATTDIAVDYTLVPNAAGRSKGYLVAATNNQVKNLEKLAKKARMHCAMIDADALALLNCFTEVEKPENDHGTAILNIGNHHTTLVVEAKSGWPFVRNLNYAADDVIKKIAEEHSLRSDSVIKMLADETKELPAGIYESLMRLTEPFVSDIEKTLLFFSTQENSFAIRKILVCGGASLYQEIVKMLGNMLPVETVLWNPFEKMKCHGINNSKRILLKNVLKKNGPAMAVAAGLAMRNI